jgi:hypothetical protein
MYVNLYEGRREETHHRLHERVVRQAGWGSLIKRFWKAKVKQAERNGTSPPDNDAALPNPLRCTWCDQLFDTAEQALAHQQCTNKDKCELRPASRQNRTATMKDARSKLREDQQGDLPHVMLDGYSIANAVDSEVVGTLFSADGSCDRDIQLQGVKAKRKFGKLTNVWEDKTVRTRTMCQRHFSPLSD